VLLLGNSPHVSDVKLQERKPANLQLLTNWEVVSNCKKVMTHFPGLMEPDFGTKARVLCCNLQPQSILLCA